MARPLLLAGPQLQLPGPIARARRFLLRTWSGRVLLGALAVRLLDALLGLAGLSLPVADTVARVILVVYAAWGAWRALRWLSRRLLWRIRTKLLLSYLFIALVPVVLLSLFVVLAGYLFMGLAASRLVTGEIERRGEVMRATAQAALAGLPPADAVAAAVLPARVAPARSLHPALGWTLLRGGRVVSASGRAPRALPSWWKDHSFVGLLPPPQGQGVAPVLRAVWAEGDAALLLDIPADARFFADLESRTSIHVIQASERQVVEEPQGGSVRLGPSATIEVDSGGKHLRTIAGPWLFVALPEYTRWETGERNLVAAEPLPFQFQPRELMRSLSPGILSREAGPSTLPDILIYAMGVVGVVFIVMYAVALLLGLLLALSITRGVHALSVGTQRLRQGDFTHLIRIRSRDQLGELAESFNLMSRGIQDLLREQAEKERLEEELRIAREIQMSLLPGRDLVGVPGIRVAALCLPAAEVGGDYYDVLPLGDTRLGVLVADVSGKGTSAALYMAELKGLVLSLSRIYDSPARLLVETNRILAANMDSRSFVTMTYAVVDTAVRCMRYARAGHNPMIHFEARTGRTRILAPAGLGLGLDRGERFERILEEETVPLVAGDCFLFFTDGLSEAMNPGAELFGEGRLRRILERSEELGSEELKERILEEVRAFVGDAAPHDDMTLVVLKVVPEGQGT